MPLPIHIPGKDLFDERTGKFITIKETNILLEHSLISISNWESKWHKPYLSSDKKTTEEYFSYLQCMCLTKNVDPNVFYAIDADGVKRISEYIVDPMTATTFKKRDQKKNREIITSELIYLREAAQERAALNASRRAKYHTRG